MKVVVHEAAARDLDDILDWISRDNPRAAAELVRRVLARIDRLAIPGLSHVGRPGQAQGTRELVNSLKRHISLSMRRTSPRMKLQYLPSFTGRVIARARIDGILKQTTCEKAALTFCLKSA